MISCYDTSRAVNITFHDISMKAISAALTSSIIRASASVTSSDLLSQLWLFHSTRLFVTAFV